MKNVIFGAVALLLQFAFPAQAADLVTIATSERGDVKYSVRPDTVNRGKNKGGEEITSAIFEVSNDRGINVRDIYVVNSDCDKGFGKIFTLDVDGKFRFSTEYVRGGNSIASGVADFLCKAYILRKNAEKPTSRQSETTAEADKKWRETIDEFLRTEAVKQDGIDYRKDSDKMQMLDAVVKQLAKDPQNEDKTMLWFLMEADKIVKQRFVYLQ